ncbi:heme-binding protein [Leisingera aquaemixtae]|uniref:Heme-binding protein n=1 Tax=Leisingera aquaemixtae TaxID=1396826 RepID=A0ABY5WGW8_9RHOB|nr:heme-binding protein [Leisingera aquaemixtae]UWQ40706.1 heme-binding protein [Leisingera aquaemixtae]
MIRKLILTSLLAPASLAAQELPTAAYLPLGMATKAAQAALGACAADGYNVSVAIVARDGATKVHLKADNSGPHTVGSAQGKAFTSASMSRDTAGLANFIGENPQHDGLRYMDRRMVIQGGGLPIRIGGALVGGLGVGGAPGGHLDEACARAGLDAISAE